jgi:amino acid transporter
LATAVVTLIMTIQSSFYSAVTIATTTRLLIYATTCLALPVFRRRNNVPAARFTAPFGVAAAILSIALIFWLLANVKYDVEGLPIVVAAVIGLIIYFAYKLVRSSSANS